MEKKNRTSPRRRCREKVYCTTHNRHFRDLRSWAYAQRVIPQDCREYIESLLPLVTFKGRKLNHKRDIAVQCIHNLFLVIPCNGCVSDTRRKTAPGVRLRVEVWDAIIAAGLARMCRGSELARKLTRYRPTGKSYKLCECMAAISMLDTHLDKSSELERSVLTSLVVAHTGRKRLFPLLGTRLEWRLPPGERKQPLPFPTRQPLRAVLCEIEDRIEFINRSNLDHSWKAFYTVPGTNKRQAYQPNVCLRHVHSGWWGRAAHLYSWGPTDAQNIPKSERKNMLIDGEPVTELDFSGYHMRILYHKMGIDPSGDVYKPAEIFPKFYASRVATAAMKATVRDFVKKATNICLNVLSRQRASAAIAKLFCEHTKKVLLFKVIYKCEKTDFSELVSRILDAHPDVAHCFFQFPERGVLLMTEDSLVMLDILTLLAMCHKPALGIHDSVLCRASDAGFAKQAMTLAYAARFHGTPVIHKVY